jgi:hypothetical protein
MTFRRILSLKQGDKKARVMGDLAGVAWKGKLNMIILINMPCPVVERSNICD